MGGAAWATGGGGNHESHEASKLWSEKEAPSGSSALLPDLLVLGCLMGQKLKTRSLVTWAMTRAMAWAALVLGLPMERMKASTLLQLAAMVDERRDRE